MSYKFFVLSILFFSQYALGAPTPIGSSSLLLNERPNIYRSPLGFELHTDDTDWVAVPKAQNSKYIVATYLKNSKSSGVQAAFTVRVDDLDKNIAVERYIRKWIKDYPRLGFEILTSKKVKLNKETGYLLDLLNRDSKMQIRQLLFVKNKHIINLSCRDQVQGFTETLKDCNKIFRTFNF